MIALGIFLIWAMMCIHAGSQKQVITYYLKSYISLIGITLGSMFLATFTHAFLASTFNLWDNLFLEMAVSATFFVVMFQVFVKTLEKFKED